ncbi:hypothetical protein SORBI_3003G268100 [Sorghum bicolor]|uniref:Uncharacterized protein n=1 Tax=Sorghum bicolor TaxID=4558 RepID=A0A1B6Q5K2_SORBI|nr:hypothetical protein SORBI_3003G268100 [Sorghum bicolor]
MLFNPLLADMATCSHSLLRLPISDSGAILDQPCYAKAKQVLATDIIVTAMCPTLPPWHQAGSHLWWSSLFAMALTRKNPTTLPAVA